MSSFETLQISQCLCERLAEREILAPSEIQTRVIPAIARGADIAFRSATGTGKTFAYLLPIVEALHAEGAGVQSRQVRVVILAPTIELASQIRTEADFLCKAFEPPIQTALLTGDANMTRQIDKLKADKPTIVVGNPARLAQLEKMGKLKLGGARFLVLDEADRLCAEELLGATKALVSRLPEDRQTIACSATLPKKFEALLASFLKHDAVREDLKDTEVLRTMIEHWALFSEGRRKIGMLRGFLRAAKGEKTLVFTDRKGQVDNIASQLLHHGLSVTALYGDMDKVTRKKAIDDFRAGRATVLVTSDLSARGLDIADLTHVVALDVPQTEEAYAHRAGRTARAGKRGIMVTIGDEVELPRLAALEKRLGIVIYPKVLYQGRIEAPEAIGEEGEEAEADDTQDRDE